MLSQSESSCADREYLRCSRTRDLGSGVIRAVQSGDTRPWLHIFYPFLPLRFCEILYPPGFAGRRWSSGLGSDCFPTQCLYMFMPKTYFWKFQFFLFVRTPQCSSDDLPQLSVFEAFFVSMPCCCRLDLGSVIWDRCLQAEHGNVQFL